jgi:hypothetical protein
LENFFTIQLILRAIVNGIIFQLLLGGYASDFLISRVSGSGILALSFAYDVPTRKNDHLVQAAEYTIRLFSELAVPGRTLVNIVPFLKHIPPWVPGADTQRRGAKAKKMVKQYKVETFDRVKRDMVTFVSAKIGHH